LPFKVIQLYVWSPSKQIVVLRMIQYLLKIKIMGSLKNIKIGLDKYSNLFCNPFLYFGIYRLSILELEY
jgi:hypothetical protein